MISRLIHTGPNRCQAQDLLPVSLHFFCFHIEASINMPFAIMCSENPRRRVLILRLAELFLYDYSRSGGYSGTPSIFCWLQAFSGL